MSGAQLYNQAQSGQLPFSYTQFPNWILESGHLFDGNALKIVNFMTRFTIGFHRPSHHFAVSYLAIKLNLSKPTVIKAIDSLISMGAIICLGSRGQTRIFQVNRQNPFPKVAGKTKSTNGSQLELAFAATDTIQEPTSQPAPAKPTAYRAPQRTREVAKLKSSKASSIKQHKQQSNSKNENGGRKTKKNKRPKMKVNKSEFLTIRGKDFLPLAVKVFYPVKEIISNKLEKIKAAYAASISFLANASLSARATNALKTKHAKRAAGRKTSKAKQVKLSGNSKTAKVSNGRPNAKTSNPLTLLGTSAAALSTQRTAAATPESTNLSQANVYQIQSTQAILHNAQLAKAVDHETPIALTENGKLILNAWRDFVTNIGKKPTTGQCIGYIAKANDLAASGYTVEDIVGTLEKIQKLHPDRLTLGWIPHFYRDAKLAQVIAIEKQPKSDAEIEAENRQTWYRIVADWKSSGQWEKFEPYRQDEMLIYAGLLQPHEKRNIPPR